MDEPAGPIAMTHAPPSGIPPGAVTEPVTMWTGPAGTERPAVDAAGREPGADMPIGGLNFAADAVGTATSAMPAPTAVNLARADDTFMARPPSHQPGAAPAPEVPYRLIVVQA